MVFMGLSGILGPHMGSRAARESIIAPPSAIGKVVQVVSGSSTQVLSDLPVEHSGQVGALETSRNRQKRGENRRKSMKIE